MLTVDSIVHLVVSYTDAFDATPDDAEDNTATLRSSQADPCGAESSG